MSRRAWPSSKPLWDRCRRRAMQTIERHETMAIHSESDIVAVRQAVRHWAVELSLSRVEQTKMVTAASELARNTLVHGGGGTVKLEALTNGLRRGLRLTF